MGGSNPQGWRETTGGFPTRRKGKPAPGPNPIDRHSKGSVFCLNLKKRRGISQRNVTTEGVAAGYICGGFLEADLTCKSAEDKGGRTAADPAPANIPCRQAPDCTTTRSSTQSYNPALHFLWSNCELFIRGCSGERRFRLGRRFRLAVCISQGRAAGRLSRRQNRARLW